MIDRSLRSSSRPLSHTQILTPPVQFVRFDRQQWYPSWPRVPVTGGSGVSDSICLVRCAAPVLRSVVIPTTLVPDCDVNDQHSVMEHFLWEEINSYHVPVLLRGEDDRFVSKTMLELIFSQNLFTLFHLDKPIEAVKPTQRELSLIRKINEFHMAGQLLRILPFDRWNDQLISFESLLERFVINPLSPCESSHVAASSSAGWVQINNVFLPFVRTKGVVDQELNSKKDEIPFAPVTRGVFVPLDILLDCPVLSDRATEQIIRSFSIQANSGDLNEINRLISDAKLSSELLKPGARLVQIFQLMACIPRLFVRFLPSNNPRRYVSRRFSEAAVFNGGVLRLENNKLFSPFIYNLRSTKIHGDWVDLSLLSLEHLLLPCSIWNCNVEARPAKPAEVEYFELLSGYFSSVLRPARANEALVCAKSLAAFDDRLRNASVMFLEAFQQRHKEVLLRHLCKVPTGLVKASRSSNQLAIARQCLPAPNSVQLTQLRNGCPKTERPQDPALAVKQGDSAVLLRNPAIRLCKEAPPASAGRERIDLIPVNVRGKKLLSICSKNRQKIPLAELKDMFFPDLSSELVHLLCSQHLSRCSSQEMDVLQRFKIDRHNNYCVRMENVEQVLNLVLQNLRLRNGGQQQARTVPAAVQNRRVAKQRRNAASDAEKKIRISLMCDQSSEESDEDQPRRCTRSREQRRHDNLSSSEADGDDAMDCRKRCKRKAR